MKILVTGTAGFIGMHVAGKLLGDGHDVVGVDNLNDYYDVNLKRDRLRQIEPHPRFSFMQMDLSDQDSTRRLFAGEGFERVVHLAAQPGVRYSLEHPHAYINSNVMGFMNVLEGCRHHDVKHLVYASSSSVYGSNTDMPFSEHHHVDHPVSLYAATKKSNELMAHAYSHLYRLPTTGLRFFTVYGPWGRPDMSPYIFATAIQNEQPINVFNHGRMRRDFTYIDDVVEGVVNILGKTAEPSAVFDRANPDPATSDAPYRIYNIGNNEPVELMKFIEEIERAMGKKAKKNLLPMQAGDVEATYADLTDLRAAIGFKPYTPLEIGIRKFVEWFIDYKSAGSE